MYLPSQDELNLLYIERDRVCCFSNGLFASSTEFYEQPSNFALVLDFTNGGVPVNQEKNGACCFAPFDPFNHSTGFPIKPLNWGFFMSDTNCVADPVA